MADKKTLLVVDDEPGLIEAISYDFERRGFHVLTAENGAVARGILQLNKVDAVITDIRMPGGDGIELLKWLKAAQPDVPCLIFITATTDLSHEQAFDIGAAAIFAKPFDRKALKAAVDRLVEPDSNKWIQQQTDAPVHATDLGTKDSATEPKLVNVGHGGMFVRMPSPLPKPGSYVRFKFDLPAGTIGDGASALSLEGIALVRWVRAREREGKPIGCGLEFSELTDTCRDQVVNLTRLLKTKAFIPAA